MDIFYKVIALLGGLSMFLYGMRLMGDGLKSSSGGAMKKALARVTAKPALGFLFGMLVTCMIQSSTATIVLTVGLVGAGFLTFRQSVGIVLGANVGTAITAQIIRLMDLNAGAGSFLYFFKADNLAPIALILGIVCIMFLKGDRMNTLGTICIGFGILFMGLIYMSAAVSDMGDMLSVLLTAFEDNYFLGFLSGVVVTGIIQSSSAVVGILQSLASSVGLNFCGVFAVIIGVNIGDCITTFIVSRIGAKPDQVRTALVHVIYNVCAAVLIIVVLTVLRTTGILNDAIWNMQLNSGGVANVHGIFRLVPALLLLPFSGAFASLAERIVPDRSAEEDKDSELEEHLKELDMHLVSNPSLALDQSGELIQHMGETAIHNYEACIQQLFEYDEARQKRMEKREDLLDHMADAANRYVVDLSPYITLEKDSIRQSYQIKALTCYERIGDHAINIANNLTSLKERKGTFSEKALADIRILTEAVRSILERAEKAVASQDYGEALMIEPMEEVIDALTETLKSRHIKRMTKGECDVYSGIQYDNILSNLERISDQCSDLALAVMALSRSNIFGQEHQYIHDVHRSNSKKYQDTYQAEYDRYFGELKKIDQEQEQTG